MRLTTIEVAIEIPDDTPQARQFMMLSAFDTFNIPTVIKNIAANLLEKSPYLKNATINVEE